MPRRAVILNLAALRPTDIGPDCPTLQSIAQGGAMRPLTPPYPVLTCPSHASMLTGSPPAAHGIIGNGFYDRAHGRVFNWNRSDGLVSGERIWDAARKRSQDFRTANLFWRFCTHSSCDTTLTERPTYWADGRKTADVFARPQALRQRLTSELGEFPFFTFWGPKAGLSSSRWILDAAINVWRTEHPNLLLVYAPYLDYDGQRFGPDSTQARQALRAMDTEIARLQEAVHGPDVDLVVVSDYGFVPVRRPLFPNRTLREHGLLEVQQAPNGELLEPATSRAFAVCDNQSAHVYVAQPQDVEKVAALLAGMDGVAAVHDRQAMEHMGIAHPRSGELLAIAEPDAWFAYPYWLDEARAPDFARCVAIFDKPGFDPCELLMAEGLQGKLHVALRFAQLKTGIRAPFDVINANELQVRGARNARPQDEDHSAVLVTSWAQEAAGAIPMEALKDLVLRRLFEDAPIP